MRLFFSFVCYIALKNISLETCSRRKVKGPPDFHILWRGSWKNTLHHSLGPGLFVQKKSLPYFPQLKKWITDVLGQKSHWFPDSIKIVSDDWVRFRVVKFSRGNIRRTGSIAELLNFRFAPNNCFVFLFFFFWRHEFIIIGGLQNGKSFYLEEGDKPSLPALHFRW